VAVDSDDDAKIARRELASSLLRQVSATHVERLKALYVHVVLILLDAVTNAVVVA
jgi:hypothetical protein